MALSSEEKKLRANKRKKEKYKNEHKAIDGVVYKICKYKNHWVIMNDENFYKNKSNTIDGYSNICRICEIEKASARQKDKAEEVSEYHRKLYKANPDYYKENAKRSMNNKPKLHKANQKRWRQNNPDRCNYLSSLHRNHDVNTKEYQAMLKVFNNSCAYCGMTMEEHKKKYKEKLHNDHVDDEGYNDLRNDVPSCKSCNCGKHEKVMEEWYKEQKIFSEERLEKIIWWTTEGYKDYIEIKLPYRFSRSRVYNDDGTWKMQHELWTVDEKRNMLECIKLGKNLKELKEYVNEKEICICK
jgi:hypothetical protein